MVDITVQVQVAVLVRSVLTAAKQQAQQQVRLVAQVVAIQ
jgi:hypothetical protein